MKSQFQGIQVIHAKPNQASRQGRRVVNSSLQTAATASPAMNSLKSIRATPHNPYQTGRASSVLQTHQQQHKNILKLNEYGTPNTLSQARRSSLKNASNPYLGRLGVFEGSKKSMNMSGALTESTQKRVRINDKPIVSDLNDVSTARLKFDEASSNKVAAETTTSSNVKYTSMFTDSPRNHEPKLQATQKKSLYKSPGDYQSRLLKLHQAASVGVVPLTQPSLPFLQNTQVDNSILLKSRNKMKQHNSMLVESQAKDTPPLIPSEANCGSLIKIRGLINTEKIYTQQEYPGVTSQRKSQQNSGRTFITKVNDSKESSNSRSRKRESPDVIDAQAKFKQFALNVDQLNESHQLQMKLYQRIRNGLLKNNQSFKEVVKPAQSPIDELLHATAKHDHQLETFKLQMLVQDNRHRKSLMMLRVAGLNKIAPHFTYFRDVINQKREGSSSQDRDPLLMKKRTSMRDKIIFDAMVKKEYL